MRLTPGTRLGSYEILAPLGAGGMGEVYRGRVTRLDREVAVKVLPAALAQDRERLARFEREAKVLASLNHPNIAQIYGFEENGETRALVMELVSGSTLSVPQPIETALDYARQIAEALEAAHEKGITHRDLKPANIMITPGGMIKVLDFGLATAPGRETSGDPDLSPTFTMGATQAGMIMGTAAYMSPEQASGKVVDKRSDIWSFGVVLFEMLSGAKLFDGETVAHTLADVLRSPLDLPKLTATVPGPIAELLNRCLDRDPKTRLRDIGEARIAIQRYLAGPSRGIPPVPQTPKAKPSRTPWVVAAGLAVVAALLGHQAYRQSSEPPARTTKSFILPPGKASFVESSPPALSPDGRKLAFVAADTERPLLWIRDLDTLTARSLTGTEGALEPFWSPDSQSVGFFADGRLKRIDLAGGTVLTLCSTAANGHGGTWSTRGVILFPNSATSGLFRVASTGGTPAPVTSLDEAAGEISHRLPWFMPDGRHFLFSVRNQDQTGKSAVYVGDLDSKDRLLLLKGEAHAAYVASGSFLVFTMGGGSLETPLMAQAMDASTFRLTGTAFPIAEAIDHSPAVWAQFQYSVAPDGTLVYSSGGTRPVQLTWLDRSGKVTGTLSSPGGVTRGVAISPDGRTVAMDCLLGGTGDIWLYDILRGALSRFTFHTGGTVAMMPSWSPDGTELTFAYSSSKSATVMRQSLGGKGAAEPAGEAWGNPPRRVNSQVWSPDGRFVVARLTAGGMTGADLWIMPLNPAGEKPRPLLEGSANQVAPSISPGSDWIAYASDETRRFEIYVQSFPTLGKKYQVSVNGGANPRWSRDGKELFYIAPDRLLMAVAIRNNGGRLEIGTPKALFDSRMRWDLNVSFDVSKDGRFLILRQEETTSTPWTLVTNWQASVRK